MTEILFTAVVGNNIRYVRMIVDEQEASGVVVVLPVILALTVRRDKIK